MKFACSASAAAAATTSSASAAISASSTSASTAAVAPWPSTTFDRRMKLACSASAAAAVAASSVSASFAADASAPQLSRGRPRGAAPVAPGPPVKVCRKRPPPKGDVRLERTRAAQSRTDCSPDRAAAASVPAAVTHARAGTDTPGASTPGAGPAASVDVARTTAECALPRARGASTRACPLGLGAAKVELMTIYYYHYYDQ
ncbi:hypothetical protein T492DRAFT_848457 [Pavlovales sp. CCMP2436]|nr:hypothetical protein T492DRAFT_848457 [Pavlovales sp. CCMP2436]